MEARYADSPSSDYFQEAVSVLKTAMQSEQQFKRGVVGQGAEAAALYNRGLEILDLAIGSDRHVAIRPQLQQKSTDVHKKVRALLRRVDPSEVEAARARMSGELAATRSPLWLTQEPDPSTPAGVPVARSNSSASGGGGGGGVLGLTPANASAGETYATPTGDPADRSTGTPRTVQRSVALQQATAARHELFDNSSVMETSSSGVALPPAPADVTREAAGWEARVDAVSRRAAAAAEQRALASEDARRRAEETLRQSELHSQAAEARATEAEWQLAAANQRHAEETGRLASERGQVEAWLAEEVAAARERGREEGIALSPRGRADSAETASAAVPAAVAVLAGAYGVGEALARSVAEPASGKGESKVDVSILRRKLAAAQ